MATIKLYNMVNIKIEKEYIDAILALSNLPSGSVSLVLHDSSLPDGNQGVCVAQELLHFDPEYNSIFCGQNSTMWDCGIAIARKWCEKRQKYPSYFTYLLGHELGHAYICLSDINLHIHCCLIHLCIRPASDDRILFPHELPDEQLFDQFGKYLTSKLHHGTDELDREIEIISKSADEIEKNNLVQLKRLAPSNEFSNLRKRMIDFSMPYKSALIHCWKELVRRDGSNSIASLFHDYEALFIY